MSDVSDVYNATQIYTAASLQTAKAPVTMPAMAQQLAVLSSAPWQPCADVDVTPLTKLGELGSELVYDCVLKSKTGVQVKDDIKICYFLEDSTKKSPNYVNQELQIASSNDTIMKILGLL